MNGLQINCLLSSLAPSLSVRLRLGSVRHVRGFENISITGSFSLYDASNFPRTWAEHDVCETPVETGYLGSDVRRESVYMGMLCSGVYICICARHKRCNRGNRAQGITFQLEMEYLFCRQTFTRPKAKLFLTTDVERPKKSILRIEASFVKINLHMTVKNDVRQTQI